MRVIETSITFLSLLFLGVKAELHPVPFRFASEGLGEKQH